MWWALGILVVGLLSITTTQKLSGSEVGTWIWPLPEIGGRTPVVTDGFNSPRPGLPRHGGVDLMYPKTPDDHGSGDTRTFWIPPGTQAIAASSGKIWSAGPSPRGFEVVIDHGKAATYYAHLEDLKVRKGQFVEAGEDLGTVGISPQDPEGVRHLHFELWLGGPSDRIDPEPSMRRWGMLRRSR